MKRRIVVVLCTALASCVVAAVMAVTLRGSFLHGFVSATVLIGLGGVSVAVAIAGFVAGLLWRRRRNGCYWVGTVGGALLVLSIVQFASIPAGCFLLERDVAEARSYCESLVPLLEAYEQQHGSYPQQLGEVLPPGRRVPRLLKDQDFYEGHGSYFQLEFSVHDGFLPTIHVYYPYDGVWRTYR
jgi:hypothetical protein